MNKTVTKAPAAENANGFRANEVATPDRGDASAIQYRGNVNAVGFLGNGSVVKKECANPIAVKETAKWFANAESILAEKKFAKIEKSVMTAHQPNAVITAKFASQAEANKFVKPLPIAKFAKTLRANRSVSSYRAAKNVSTCRANKSVHHGKFAATNPAKSAKAFRCEGHGQ